MTSSGRKGLREGDFCSEKLPSLKESPTFPVKSAAAFKLKEGDCDAHPSSRLAHSSGGTSGTASGDSKSALIVPWESLMLALSSG